MPPPQNGSGALPAPPLDLPDAAAQPSPVRGVRGHLRAVPAVPLDFDAAVRTLGPRLQRYAVRRLGDRHEAEELVQEALLRAYQHRGALATEDDLAAWTTCVTGRLVIDRLRVRGRSTSVAEVPEGDRSARDTADVVVARDQARMALDALDAMPPRQAAVLWAREVEGLAYDTIGARYGMSEPAVRSLLTRARKALRKEYATRGGTLPGAGLALLAPWVSGTSWLERLRTGVERGPGLASLGVVGVGLVTGALVLPAAPDGPATTPAPLVASTSVPGPPAPADPPAVDTPAAAPAGPASTAAVAGEPVVVVPAPPRPEPAPVTPLERSGLDGTCLDAGSAGAGGADCAAPPPQRELQVDLPLEQAPGGLETPTVATDRVPCSTLPDLPLTQCTSPGEAP